MASPTAPLDSTYFTDAGDLGIQEGLNPRQSGAVTDASALIAKFRKGTSKAFAHLDRESVANSLEMQLRLESFRQEQSPFCGVAIFVRFWAWDSPQSYTQFAIDLFEKGRARLESAGKHSGKLVVPSPELRAAKPQLKMSDLDWMVMASIREALANDFNYLHYKTVFQSIKGLYETNLVAEFKAAGYSKIVDGDSLLEASNYYQKNWRVVLRIRAWMLNSKEEDAYKEKKKLFGSMGFHYLGLDSEVFTKNVNGKILIEPFRVWTWGHRAMIPAWKKPLPMDDFLSYFYYVAAKF